MSKDTEYSKKFGSITNYIGIIWGNINTIDFTIVKYLKIAAQTNILIDERKS